MSLTLCVLLWPHPGAADALIAYEDQVLDLVSGHGGRVLQRARSNGTDGQPLEIHLLEFPSAAALEDYMTDPRRVSLAADRDRAIARTQIVDVDLIQSGGASFTSADFTGARFRDCDLRQVKIVDSWLADVSVSGYVSNLAVNDVDVTEFVAAELDRRHPERVQLRQLHTAADYRAMWDTIEQLWSDTVARAGRLPEPARHERVDDEWSFAETMRHLVFATDAWASRTVLDEPMPYHRLGLTHTGYPPADAAALGIDLDAHPSFAEVMTVRAGRMATVRGIVAGLTDGELERLCARAPAPGYPEESRSVGRCLRVVMDEECAHHRYAIRDLALLEAR